MGETQGETQVKKPLVSKDNKLIVFLIGLPVLAWLPGAGLPGTAGGWGTVAVFSAFMLTFWAFVMR